MNLPTAKPHPLKTLIRHKGLKLWQIRTLLDDRVSEPKLSRCLSGVEKMPDELEQDLSKVIKMI